jgi:hypothetical protein
MASGKTKKELGGAWSWLGSYLIAGFGICGNVSLGILTRELAGILT